VKKVQPNLVEQQRGAQYNKNNNMEPAFFHYSKIRILNFAPCPSVKSSI
jgi:hypothetical protein